MAVRFDVYDVTNTTKLGELAEPHQLGFYADLRAGGTMLFSLDAASAADRALLAHLRIVRVNIDGTDREAYIVQDKPSEMAPSDERPVVAHMLRHLLSWVGYQQGGAVLWPYGGLTGLQQSPRWFGPMSFDFPAVVRPEPTTGGPLTREGWPDPRAERFVFASHAVYRRLLTGNPALDGPSRMWFTTAAWTEARVWFDGAELLALSTPVGETSIRTYDLPYDGLDHVVFIDARGTPPAGKDNSLGWTWGLLLDDANGEPNILGNRLFTTFNSTTYTGPTAPTVPYWQAWEGYTDYPGVTVGFVAGTALDEAQARGLLPGVTRDFDNDDDSGGNAWTEVFARAFPMQKVGHLLDALAPFRCEPEMTPAGLLRLHQQRGTDRTATVTVTTGFSLSATGRGPIATRYLYETEGGFGAVTDAAAEAALGVALEDVAQLGEDIDPDTILAALTAQLTLDASTADELQVGLPPGVVPYDDVFLGDTVQCKSDVDGTVADVRITSFTAELRPEGDLAWAATAVRVS